MIYDILEECIGFEWDTGNFTKNQDKHKVSQAECEQVFFNLPILIMDDEKHSKNESRFYVLGQTDFERKIFLVFTIRKQYIRVISARDMNRKERAIYGHKKETTSF